MTRQTNNILRRLTLALLLATATVRGWGDGRETLTFFVNGSPVRIMLADRPAITYTGNTLHVRTTGSYFDIPVSSISAGVFQAWAMPGDVNTDGQVGIGDIVAITNFMAGNTGGMTEAQADVNGDGDVGIGDIVAITNIMAGTGGTTEPSLLSCPDNNHPHMIDLGLPSGTKWACCNVGASTPEEYGGYYTFGQVSSAPTLEQIQELVNKCSYTWTEQNGVVGGKFTGSNGGTVFLPAAGYAWYGGRDNVGSSGYYWSSTPNGEDYAFQFGFNSYGAWHDHIWYDRDSKRSVRPVR